MLPLKDSRTQTLNPYLLFSCITASLSAFNAGHNLGAPNQPQATITQCKNIPFPNTSTVFNQCLPMSPFVWGLCVGLFAVGGLIGGLSSSKLTTMLGRKRALLYNNSAFIFGGILMATANSVPQFAIGRVFVGFGSGFATSVVSAYIGEISTPRYRGALGSLLQLLLVIGIFVAQSIGIPLSRPALQAEGGFGWRLLFALTAVPSFLQLALLPFCVETPRYLISKGRLDEAKKALQKLRGRPDVWDIEGEYSEMLGGQGKLAEGEVGVGLPNGGKVSGTTIFIPDLEDDETGQPGSSTSLKPRPKRAPASLRSGASLRQIWSNLALRRTLFIALTIHLCQQLTGINSVIFYSTSIFEMSYGSETAVKITVIVAIVNLVSTMASLFLVDRLGRKSLLLTSEVGMTVFASLLVIASVYNVGILVVIAVNLFVASFAIGLGSIPWLLMPELFSTHVLAKCNGLANGVNWLSNFSIGLIFPPLQSILGDYAFIPFIVLSVLAALFTITFVPETKGKSLEELGMASEGLE